MTLSTNFLRTTNKITARLLAGESIADHKRCTVMGARTFLAIGLIILALAWFSSTTGLLRGAPTLIRYIVAGIFIFGAVRVGLSIAIIAFDLSPASYAIPVAFGLLAFWFRPGRNPAGASSQ